MTLPTGPAVVKAWAPWCTNCRTLAPTVDEVAARTGTPVISCQVDVDPATVDRFGIRSVPTLIAVRDGVEVGRLVGLQPSAAVASLFAAAAGEGEVRPGTTPALDGARGLAGIVLAGTGAVLASLPLVMIGAVLVAWALVGLLRAGLAR